MRPIEGILTNKLIKNFLNRLKKNGSKFSYRKIKNKKRSVYFESNITIFDALKKSDKDKKGKYGFERYLTAHAMMFSFDGVPAVYFNSFFGKSNDETKYVITGNNRDINRYRWNEENILNKLENKKSKESLFFNSIKRLLSIRIKQKAFHPNASRFNLNFGSTIFSFKRISLDKKRQ